MKDLAFHEIANCWPLLEGEDFDDLVEDIRKHGQRLPCLLWEGKILDGRNRYLACLHANVEARCENAEIPDGCDPVEFVASLNDHRRHQSQSQLGIAAAKARKWYDEEAKKRMREGGEKAGKGRPQQGPANLPDPIGKGDARDKAGKAFGVSGKTVDYGTRVLEHGSEKLIKAVEQGKVAVSTAARMSSLPHDKQDDWLTSAKGRPQKKGSDGRPEDKANMPMQFAMMAIANLERIQPRHGDDGTAALRKVRDWIDAKLKERT